MSKYRFTQLDVFTNEPFAGNPLAVFPEAEGLSDDEMMKVAREMNLSETVFVLKPQEQTADGQQRSAVSNRYCGVCASSNRRARFLSRVIRLWALD